MKNRKYTVFYKKINTKYDKMAEKLSQTTSLSKTRKTKNNSKKNNVIEITELKDKTLTRRVDQQEGYREKH